MGRRTLLLIASILIAAAGTTVVALYAKSADTRATGNASPVQVLVAKSAIAAGSTGSSIDANSQLIAAEYPQKLVRQGMFTGPNAVANFKSELEKRTTVSRVLPGQPIEKGMFADPGEATQLGITAGNRGISASLDDQARAAGLLRPGSTVDVYLTSEGARSLDTKVILEKVRVIGIGSQLSSGGPAAAPASKDSKVEELESSLITLDLTPAQVEIFLTAQESGKLQFAVIGPEAKP